MKPSRNDPFDLNLCMRGLGTLITHMHSDVYAYMYYFTFKKSFKSYARDFNDPWEQHIEHLDFFENVDDPLVKNCLITMGRLIDYKIELNLIFGIDEPADLEDEAIVLESNRFSIYFLVYKRSKSYKCHVLKTVDHWFDTNFIKSSSIFKECLSFFIVGFNSNLFLFVHLYRG